MESRDRITTSPTNVSSKRRLNFISVSGFLLLARVVAVTFCVTLAASLAARHGPTIMAGFQICCQLWLATSLLADGLAVAGQVRLQPCRLVHVVSFITRQHVTIELNRVVNDRLQAVLASAFAKNDNKKVVDATSRVLQVNSQ